MKKSLPIGVDNFEDLITNEYYYVDKTLFIRELLDLKGKVNLFTRPRRFGKTLNLSMLRYFFEDTGKVEQNAHNRALFEPMKIMSAGSIYTDKMGRFPVINLTLKSAKQATFNEAYYTALRFLSLCLNKATGKKVVILIDEYDVPLENAYFRGFYQEMTDFIRSLFESALKTNDALEFAVITGCLRISKESIFTGLNHLNIISVLDKSYAEHFGFTTDEVCQMVEYYGHTERMGDIQRWYDGYSFGEQEIYNPWSVIRFMADLNADKEAVPVPYWVNTSTNDIIRNLVNHAGLKEKNQIEALIAGKEIEIPVHEDVTYEDMGRRGDALWNILYFTGYLTKSGERLEEQSNQFLVRLFIPNVEVKMVYQNTILTWFRDEMEKQDFHDLYLAMEQEDTRRIQEIINEQLENTISFYDNAENFYHGFLAGILSQHDGYVVKSNRETGDGRCDIMIYPPNLEKRAFILELKVSKTFEETDNDAEIAIRQMEEKNYAKELEQMGYRDIAGYGIAFYRKNCKVRLGK